MCGQAIVERFGAQVDRRVRLGILVDGPHGELTETLVHDAWDQGVGGMNIDNGAGAHLCASRGVVVRGALRLDDQLADQAMAPVVDGVHVVVPEDVVELDVGVPDVLHELGTRPLTSRVSVGEGRREGDRGANDRGDLANFDAFGAFPDGDPHAGTELCEAIGRGRWRCRDAERVAPGRRAGHEGCVLKAVGANGLAEREAGANAVGGLHVKLDMVNVGIGHREGLLIIIRLLAGQRHEPTVALVEAQREWVFRLGAATDCVLVGGQRKELAEVVVRTGPGDLNPQVDRDEVEVLDGSARWANAVRPVVPDAVARGGAVLAEPRCAGVPVRRERRAQTDLWSQKWVGGASVDRVEQELRAIANEGVAEVEAGVPSDGTGLASRVPGTRIVCWRGEVCPCRRIFRRAEIAGWVGRVGAPVPYGAVPVEGRPLRWDLRLNPVLQVRRRVNCCAVEGLTDKRTRIDRVRRGLAVGKRGEVALVGVVGAPEAPHSRDVVLRNVAVVEEVASGLLNAARAALDLKIKALARCLGLRVKPAGLGTLLLRRFVETGVLVVERAVSLRVQAPANTAAVQVVDVQHLAARVEDADLGGVAQVATRHWCRRVAERERVVGERLAAVLCCEAIHERL